MKDLIQTKHFRIAPITRIHDLDDAGRLQFETLPTASGVAIEQPVTGGKWQVIAYVTPTYAINHEGEIVTGTYYDELSDRILFLSFFERLELNKLIKIARKMVITANKKK